MIELKNITKKFYTAKTEVTALSGLSLAIPRGKIFGVIGESGAGKSTLIRCVNLLEKPTAGEVWVNGKNLVELSSAELARERSHIGMIFQHFNLLASRTVAGNIAMPLELAGMNAERIRQRTDELLSLVGLEDKRNEYPAKLSGGQKQRVAIARALANDPRVLLCDEATSALDPNTTRSILNLLKDINLRLGLTILLITHEMEVVKSICDHVAVISDGILIEQGTVKDIFSNPQQELTRRFIFSSLHVEVPLGHQERLAKKLQRGRPLLKLVSSGRADGADVLSEAARSFNVDNHIIAARVDSAGGATFGIMLVEIEGNADDADRAVEFFITKNINTEVLGYV